MISKDDCWLWAGLRYGGGHGKVYIGYKNGKTLATSAHIMMYENFVGEVPEGLELDHLCETPLCINPDHLEPVTHRENTLRHYRRQTHCKLGHELTEATTRWKRRRANISAGNPTGVYRCCRECIRISDRKQKQRLRHDKPVFPPEVERNGGEPSA